MLQFQLRKYNFSNQTTSCFCSLNCNPNNWVLDINQRTSIFVAYLSKMRNFKKQMLCLLMLIPMLVLLAHDVIPHNHNHNTAEDQQVSIIHFHQHVKCNTCNHHNHGETNWNHQNEKNSESCCILTHNRVQQEIKYQIFLKADAIRLDSEDIRKVKKFRVHNYKLIPEPLRFSPHRRGPPNSILV